METQPQEQNRKAYCGLNPNSLKLIQHRLVSIIDRQEYD
jgi:hypothetical protein